MTPSMPLPWYRSSHRLASAGSSVTGVTKSGGCACSSSSSSARRRSTKGRDRRHTPAYLAELDGAGVAADHDLVAVREELAAELDQRARLGSRDRPRREQVARTEHRAVGDQVRDELRPGPVQRAHIAARQHVAIE